jgi:hypothetical protein
MAAWQVVLEARESEGLVQVGVCGDPAFLPGFLRLDRVVLDIPPAFRFKKPDVKAWLKKRSFVVTRTLDNGRCRSSTSWVCTFDSCGEINQVNDDLYYVRDLVMEI